MTSRASVDRTYIAIDLKSFYASVECKERNRDPLTTNLVVADQTRTEKTICLAVSPALKSYGIPGRPRLFEVVQKVKEANYKRRYQAPNRTFLGASDDSVELKKNKTLAIDYIVAPPRMAYYMEYSTKIYDIYLKYIAPEDMHIYSVDEVFVDVTDYLSTYEMTARELAMTMIQDVLKTTGITATAGIGTNMYLCKIAMDVVAKHMDPDKNGVRIAALNEMSYRKLLWNHRPLTDFWRVGPGYAKKLEANGLGGKSLLKEPFELYAVCDDNLNDTLNGVYAHFIKEWDSPRISPELRLDIAKVRRTFADVKKTEDFRHELLGKINFWALNTENVELECKIAEYCLQQYRKLSSDKESKLKNLQKYPKIMSYAMAEEAVKQLCADSYACVFRMLASLNQYLWPVT